MFASVIGPLQTVQRAENWVIILALQASGLHVGSDNFHVFKVWRLDRGMKP